MPTSRRTVLITGCSEGGLGAALAVAFHEAGLHVYATARNPSKLSQLASLGIQTLNLDVLSDSSIAACVHELPGLDILVNNAGAGYNMPVSDISIAEAKKLFDLNVWSCITVTQAFLPLLLKSSSGMIVNHTSVSSVAGLPFQSVYNASKAAMAMFSEAQRLELEAFGITVVDLKSGVVKSNFVENHKEAMSASLPEGSIYEPAKEVVERALRQDGLMDSAMPAHQWAKLVTQDLLRKKPGPLVWRGYQAWLVRLFSVLPVGMFDGAIKKRTGLDVVEQILRKRGDQTLRSRI